MAMTDQYVLSYVDNSLAEQKQDFDSNKRSEEERLKTVDTFGAPKDHAPSTRQLDAPIQQTGSEQANILSTEIQKAVSNPFLNETADATNEKFSPVQWKDSLRQRFKLSRSLFTLFTPRIAIHIS